MDKLSLFRRIAICVYGLLIVVMAVATVSEQAAGSSAVYGSWWFVALWAILAVSASTYIFLRHLVRRPVVLCLHAGLLLILAGAMASHCLGQNGSMHLRIGESADSLPISVRLDRFEVLNYPGTPTPMDFVAHLSFIHSGSDSSSDVVSMNNVAEHDGYRFYQAGYDDDGLGARLMFVHDPVGIGLTYAGYAVLFLSVVLILVLPNEGFRRQLRKLASFTSLSAVLLFVSSCSAGSDVPEPKALPRDVAANFCNMAVLYNGRICPMQTVAHDFTVKLTGKDSYRGLSAEQVMTGWLLFPTSWARQPMLKVKGRARSIAGNSSSRASYDDFFASSGYKLESLMRDIRAGRDVDGARSIEEADEKLQIIHSLKSGDMLRMFPYRDAESGSLRWFSQGSQLPESMSQQEWLFVRKSFSVMSEMAVTADYESLDYTVSKIRQFQQNVAGDALPSHARFKAEKFYNNFNFTRPVAMGLLTVGILSFLPFVLLWSRRMPIPRVLRVTMFSVLALVALYLAAYISLRWFVSMHVPLTNGYETMQFMSLCVMALTLVLHRKFPLVLPMGFVLSGLTMLVSMLGQANPKISALVPVLASPLLSLHVCVIMLAYSLLAFMMMNGIASLLVRRSDAVSHLADVSRLLLYPAVGCLAVGIFVGAIWANQSWGRYWGWDPKEVWALITMMIYAAPLHPSLAPALQRPRPFNLFCVVAFLCVLMTYFGVNFFLGGLHAYANS